MGGAGSVRGSFPAGLRPRFLFVKREIAADLRQAQVGESRPHEIPNPKHQITIKSQIPILNDQNRFEISNSSHFDFSSIDEKIFSIFEFGSL